MDNANTPLSEIYAQGVVENLSCQKSNMEKQISVLEEEIQSLEQENSMLRTQYFESKDYEYLDVSTPLTLTGQPMSYPQIEQCQYLKQQINEELAKVEELKEQIVQAERKIQMQEWELEEMHQAEADIEKLRGIQKKTKSQIKESEQIIETMSEQVRMYQIYEDNLADEAKIQKLKSIVFENESITQKQLDMLKNLIQSIQKLQEAGRQSINYRQQNSIMSIVSPRNGTSLSSQSQATYDTEQSGYMENIWEEIGEMKKGLQEKLLNQENDYNQRQEQLHSNFKQLEKDIKDKYEEKVKFYKSQIDELEHDKSVESLKILQEQIKNKHLQQQFVISNYDNLREVQGHLVRENENLAQQVQTLNLQNQKKYKKSK